MGIHNHSPQTPNPHPPVHCFVLSPWETTVVMLARASPESTTKTQGPTQGQGNGGPSELWIVHAVYDVGFVFNPLYFHARFQFQEGPDNKSQWALHGGVHESLENQPKVRQGPIIS